MKKIYVTEEQYKVISEAEYNYHFGNIDDPKNVKPYVSDNKSRMSGRDTGHFGSGVYFSTYKCNDRRDIDDKDVSSPEFVKIKDGVYRADFDLYKNLYRVKSKAQGDNLFYSLKEINGLYNMADSYVNYGYKFPSDFSERYIIVKNNFQYLGLKMPEYREFLKMCIKQVKNDDPRSMSTVIMEYNGFNGVNVSGIYAYDNTTHGSVVYDLSKVSDDLKKANVDQSNCELNKGETGNKIAGDYFDFKNKLLSDRDIIGTYIDEFNKLPQNEQVFAIRRYKYPLSRFEVDKLSQQTKDAYFKSLPSKIKNGTLLRKMKSRDIEAIMDNGYSKIIYDVNSKIGDETFFEYAMDQLAYTDYFDKLIKGINRTMTDEEKKSLEFFQD